MALVVTKMRAGTTKQKLNFVPMAPNTCLIPAPPPPTGPQGIPTPFPITTNTGSIKKGPVPKVKHKGGKGPNVKSTIKGSKGNQPGVGSLPPQKPKKDVVTGVTGGVANVMKGCPNCKVGGKDFVWFTSPGMGNGS